ncbi:MAG TPA: thioesterase domain-containing protein, partial [Cyclobacteriaceae bacterium]
DGTDMGAEYWVNNLRGMVQFASVIEKLLNDQHTIFIEINSHPVLVNAVNECAEFQKHKITTIASLYREKPEREEMMKNLRELYNMGYSVPWSTFFGTREISHVDLPSYPFQRERFELEDLSGELETAKESSAQFPLLGDKIDLAIASNIHYWESSVSLNKFPFLRDHIILDNIELPISCYIEIILEAVSEIFGNDLPLRIDDLKFTHYLTLSENKTVNIQVKLTQFENQTGNVHIFKRNDSGWDLLAEGIIVSSVTETSLKKVFEKIEYHAPAYTDGGSYYDLLCSIGQNYGKQFQQLTGLDRTGARPLPNVLFSIKPDNQIRLTSDKYKIHPAVISSFFQPVFVQLTSLLKEGNFLDVKFLKIGNLVLNGEVNYGRELRGLLVFQTLQQKDGTTWSFSADITIANHDNTEVMNITGLEGVIESKIPTKSKPGNKKTTSEFLEIYASGISELEKLEALEQMISYHVARIIKISPNRVKRTMTFKGMGVDSLMAVQLRNQIEKEVSLKLPVGKFWLHPNIQEYAVYLNNELTSGHQLSDNKQTDNINNAWFVIPEPNPNAALRLFCFHDAGGSASLFDGWEKYLHQSQIELVLIEMPGRGRRLEEVPYVNHKELLCDIIPALSPLLNKPYFFLGHSMGGMVAFEIIRELRRAKVQLPQMLFISSTSGLNAYTKSQVDYTLSDDELVHQYPHLHINNIGNTEMQSLLINILRADLQFLYDYEYVMEEPLSIPIIAIHGDEDERVKRDQIEQWRKETTSSFNLLSRHGGHRYIQHDGEFVARLIQQEASTLKLITMKDKAKLTL